jgi:ferredoxin--NADP+ reductase
VPGGPFTSKLQGIQAGDTIMVGRKPTGTLLIDHLLPGKRLYLLAIGTGLAPILSVIRDPCTYERFATVVHEPAPKGQSYGSGSGTAELFFQLQLRR